MKRSALERTLVGVSGIMASAVFAEGIAARPGLLQSVDARLKVAATGGLLLVTGLVKSAVVLAVLYTLTLMLARASAISIPYFLKRVWLFIPIFTGVIVIPSVFSPVVAGDPLVTIWDFGREVHIGPWSLGSSIAITKQGAAGAVTLLLRVATSVSLAVLLAVTTRWADLLRALRVFRIPRIFVFILSMTYRFIFLLLNIASEMLTARRSRMAVPSSPRADRRFMAQSMGALLGKSQALGEEVYAAMISRGYRGEPRTARRFSFRTYDAVFATAALAVAAAALGGERLIG